jgi:hypothetical protein
MDELKTYILKCGGIHKFAKMQNLRYQSVQGWIKRGKVPPIHVKRLAKQTGISEHQLNGECF